MASLMNKAKNFIFGPEFDETEDFYEEYEDVVDDREYREKDYTSISSKSKKRPSRDRDKENLEDNTPKVLNIHQSLKLEVACTFPSSVSDAFAICDYIKEGKVCIVNLEGKENRECQRIADFLGGSAYALGGDIQRISDSVFIVAPTNVEITGELKDELRETGVLFPLINSIYK